MLFAIEDGPTSAIKYQYADLTKLHQVVSMLIRCCDISSKAHSSRAQLDVAPLPNPYGDPACQNEYLMPIQPQAADILFLKNRYDSFCGIILGRERKEINETIKYDSVATVT